MDNLEFLETEKVQDENTKDYLSHLDKLAAQIEQDTFSREGKLKFFLLVLANTSSASVALIALRFGLNWYCSALTSFGIGLIPLWLKVEESKGRELPLKEMIQLVLQCAIPLGVSVRVVYEKKVLEDDFAAAKNPGYSPLLPKLSLLLTASLVIAIVARFLKGKGKESRWH